ncbi:phage terminase large subunit family protein, partial [Klebsiella pneumoniae]|nr:phage terminase large subunit family protein [Klebsiella pneumoniae]
GRGPNEAFDLLVYADALAILHGYEKIKWPDAPEWARRATWIEESTPETGEASPTLSAKTTHSRKKRKANKTDVENNPWTTSSGGWV